MHGYLKRLVDERNSLTGLVQQLNDTAEREERQLTEAEAERQRGWQQRCAELDPLISEQNDYLSTQRAWAKLQSDLAANDEPAQRGNTALATRQPAGGMVRSGGESWGEMFTNSDAFRRYDGTGSSGRVEVPGIFQQRAAIDSTFLTVPPYQFSPALWQMTTPLLDACGREPVSTGNVEWISWPASFPLAGEVAEGTAKPEADIAPAENAAALKTYAHWKGITRQALEDIPRIQAIIENALRGGILRKLEDSAAGVLTGNTDIGTTNDADLMTGIRIALGVVQSNGYAKANAILLNPADFAALDVAVMGATVAGPQLNQTFWGLSAIAAGAIPQGTAYVGDFKTGLTLFERGAASVYMTDSHSDYFVRNILVVLAETRALPVVTEPQALQKVTTVVGP